MIKPVYFALHSLGLVLCCTLLSACATAGGSSTTNQTALIERVIVQFKTPSSHPAERIAQLAKDHQLGLAFEREMGGNFYIAELKPPKTETELQPYLKAISQEADIASIEADLMMHTMPVN